MEKFKQIEIDGNEIVVQDNALIEAPRTLCLIESKMFAFIVSKFNPTCESTEYLNLRIYAKDFAIFSQISSCSDTYRDLKKMIKTLQTRVLTIYDTNKNEEYHISILSYAKYYHKLGYADIKINKDIVPYLINLKKQFTRYKLINILHLSSVYAIRMYELLKQTESCLNRTFTVDELRYKLNISENKLLRFFDFKKKVLEIAKREINNKTDITIEYECIKTGRRITHICFAIHSKNPHKKGIKTKQSDLVQRIQKLGVSENDAVFVSQIYPSIRLENALLAVEEQQLRTKIVNPFGMLTKALQQKWKPNQKIAIEKEAKILKAVGY